MIPIQLQKPLFKFVLLGEWNKWKNKKTDEIIKFEPVNYDTFKKNKEWVALGKAPFEKAWQKVGYKFDDTKLIEHIKTGNYGVIGGEGKLRILDIDDENLSKIFEGLTNTFTVRTGGGGRHFYFISEYDKNHVLINELGELRSNNYQVVCPPCRHPSGRYYEITKDIPIQEIFPEELKKLILPYLRKEIKTEILKTENGSLKEIDTSRSGLEYRKVIALLMEGKTKEEIFNQMNAYSKWTDHGGKFPQYREETYNKAIEYTKSLKILPQPLPPTIKENKEDYDYYDDAELMNYIPKEQDWLVKNQIPKEEVGLLVGKRGERKTFVALHQALCIASGEKVFGYDDVPEAKKVLIIDEETGKNAMAQRIKMLKKGMGIETTPLNIKFLSFSGLKFDRKDKKYEKFKEIVEEFKPDLIIDDCLQRSVGFEVDKDNTSISEMFTEVVRPIIKKYKCSWLFIHHLRKAPTSQYRPEDPLDEVRGGSELVNYCRFILMCQSPRGQKETQEGGEFIVFKVLKMSNSPIPEPKVIAFTPNGNSLKVTYEGVPEDVLAGEINAANSIEKYLFENQVFEFKTSEIMDKVEEIGFKKTLLAAGLKVLWNKGKIEKAKRGFWKVTGNVKEQTKL